MRRGGVGSWGWHETKQETVVQVQKVLPTNECQLITDAQESTFAHTRTDRSLEMLAHRPS